MREAWMFLKIRVPKKMSFGGAPSNQQKVQHFENSPPSHGNEQTGFRVGPVLLLMDVEEMPHLGSWQRVPTSFGIESERVPGFL